MSEGKKNIRQLSMADLENVAVPVAEPSRGRYVGRNLGPFQPREKLLCAPENDHRIDSVIHITMRGTSARRSSRRFAAPFRADARDQRTMTAGRERPRGRRLGGIGGDMPGSFTPRL